LKWSCDKYNTQSRDDHGARVPDFGFQAGAGVYIKVCAGVNQIFKKPIKIFVTMLAVVKQNGIN